MDMTSWIEYFTDALKSQMVDVKNRGEKIIKKDLIRERVRYLNLNERQIKVLEYLTDNDSITREQYVKMFDISLRTANYDISEIEKLNLIKRAGIGRATNYMLK